MIRLLVRILLWVDEATPIGRMNTQWVVRFYEFITRREAP